MLSEERVGIIEEECGIAALWLPSHRACEMLLNALDALQHRGQEASGVTALSPCDAGLSLHTFKAPGRVDNLRVLLTTPSRAVLHAPDAMLGHVRYSTSGGRGMACAQPLVRQTRFGAVSLAHNGHITNAAQLRAELGVQADEQTSSDTSILLDLLEHGEHLTFMDALHESIARLEGAFSMVLLHEEEGLLAWRDRHGVRPLVCARVRGEEDGIEGWMLASETVAFEHVTLCSPPEEIPAGSLWQLRPKARAATTTAWLDGGSAPSAAVKNCLFELVYFASSRSRVFGVEVQQARERMGRALYLEHATLLPEDLDMVLAVPESSRPAALGFAAAASLPFVNAITRRAGSLKRSFIEPDEESRRGVVSTKFEVSEALVRGKSVVVVDDSLVRGTTAREIVALLRRAGVARISLCIASAPIIAPCFYGIDTPRKEELLAAVEAREELRRSLGVEMLCYISLDGLREAAREGGGEFCDACFSGRYLIERG